MACSGAALLLPTVGKIYCLKINSESDRLEFQIRPWTQNESWNESSVLVISVYMQRNIV
jgi:hypothetical protein